jgi:hypothetical protein
VLFVQPPNAGDFDQINAMAEDGHVANDMRRSVFSESFARKPRVDKVHSQPARASLAFLILLPHTRRMQEFSA